MDNNVPFSLNQPLGFNILRYWDENHTVQLERKSSHMRMYSSTSEIIACIVVLNIYVIR